MTGTPFLARLGGLRRPKDQRLGADFAGTVEAVGKEVTRFHPGDEIFGAANGAFAEYVVAREDRAAPKPANLTFEQAAAVPVAGLTAIQGLRDKGHIRAGQHVLINGAAGGVGTFAVQIAKSFGAEVTGVCSTHNVDTVRSIGADHVIDYSQEDFTRGARRFDLMLDNVGNRSWAECTRVLRPGATLVLVSGPKSNRLLGPLSHVIKTRLASMRSSQKMSVLHRQHEDSGSGSVAGAYRGGPGDAGRRAELPDERDRLGNGIHRHGACPGQARRDRLSGVSARTARPGVGPAILASRG